MKLDIDLFRMNVLWLKVRCEECGYCEDEYDCRTEIKKLNTQNSTKTEGNKNR